MFFTKIRCISKLLNASYLLLIRNNSYYNAKSCSKLVSFLQQKGIKVSPKRISMYDLLDYELNELKTIDDKELEDEVSSELKRLDTQLKQLEDDIIDESIIDDIDVNECCVDLNCGVGGQEAMLFTKEMFDVYCAFFAHQKWKYSVVANDCDTDFGGYRHSSFIVEGLRCYQLMRHEAGVHRVQRTPKTEKYGRVHTSTITVSVLPIRHKVIEIKDSDLEIKTTTSSGPGGQFVNKTETCVRIKHIPTGVAVQCQETRSQIQNKDRALIKLKAIINNLEYEKQLREEKVIRKMQIGIAARSDKVRTYNFPQNRITDHRLAESVHNIDQFMAGNSEKLLYLAKRLEEQRRAELVRQMRNAFEQSISNCKN